MPRGASPKRERQYKHIKQSAKKSGRYGGRAEEVAARTVNKIRREKGETKTQRAGSKKSSSRASSMRQRRRSRRGIAKQRPDSSRPQVFASPVDGCGSHRDGSQKGSMTSWKLAKA